VFGRSAAGAALFRRRMKLDWSWPDMRRVKTKALYESQLQGKIVYDARWKGSVFKKFRNCTLRGVSRRHRRGWPLATGGQVPSHLEDNSFNLGLERSTRTPWV